MAARSDMSWLLEDIQVPTQVICGVDDGITTCEEMERMKTQIPHARFSSVPDAGHMAPLENPQFVNEVIATFLGETDV